MIKSSNDFSEVSYFSKKPFLARFTSLLFFISLLVVVEVFILNYSPLSNPLKYLSLLVIFIVLIWIIRIWIISQIKFHRSPFRKLKRFITKNKLYEEEVREVGTNKNGSPNKRKVVFNSAYFLYKETDNQELIIRAWKKADKF